MQIEQRIERTGPAEYLTVVTLRDGDKERVFEKTYYKTSPIFSAYKSLIHVLRSLRNCDVTLESNNYEMLSEISNRSIENGMALLNIFEDVIERNNINVHVKSSSESL